VVGEGAFLFATVQNLGTEAVTDALLNFYVADPSLQIRKSTAQYIGAAFATIPVGGSQDVLCVSEWSVSLFNGGHECVVVEAVTNLDPLLPPPADPDVLDPPAYHQIAQRNMNVITVAPMMLHEMLITLGSGLSRVGKKVDVSYEVGGELSDGAIERLGLRGGKLVGKTALTIGLSHTSQKAVASQKTADAAGKPVGAAPKAALRAVALPPRTARPVYLTVGFTETVPDGTYGVIRVLEHSGKQLLGGLTVVVVQQKEG
jgi:hypothetical protein